MDISKLSADPGVQNQPNVHDLNLKYISPSTLQPNDSRLNSLTSDSHVSVQSLKRLFSINSFAFFRSRDGHKRRVSAKENAYKASRNVGMYPIKSSNSDKSAIKSALILRSLITGSTNPAVPVVRRANAKPHFVVEKVKSQLTQPKSANKVIAQLRKLPASETDPVHPVSHGPIHAVCLAHSDVEEDYLHFAKLGQALSAQERAVASTSVKLQGVLTAPIDQLASMIREMHIIDLIREPTLGIGQPGDGAGLLAGAVPTPETVLEGIRQITPELMALGFATGRAVLPDHSGVYPPTDRMSVLTYWWGLELLLPPPSLHYLSNAQSITGAVVNFLTALSLINNGVREILPFIRYIAQFIDFEFNNIKRQDQGKGVVCAATWIMPAALVPRPWDFPTKPDIEKIPITLPIKNGTKIAPLTPSKDSPPKLVEPGSISLPEPPVNQISVS